MFGIVEVFVDKKIQMALRLSLMMMAILSVAQGQYVQRYTTITNGAITFTGNTLGLSGSSTYTAPGTQHSIGAFTSTNSALTFGTYPAGTTNSLPTSSNTAYLLNSSAAILTLPSASTVLYAELIWGGTYNTVNDVTARINDAIDFITPAGTFSVSPATATAKQIGGRYVRSQNVTGLVQIAGAGSYTVARVPATANTNATANTAGWTLAVIYGNPTLQERNLTLFIGAENSGAAAAGVSGFCTPLSGTPQGRLMVSAMEGDASINGDQMQFGPNTGAMVPVSGPNNPINNFFSSQINRDNGSLDTTGTHGLRNHNAFAGSNISAGRQGWDITNVDVTAALTNGQSSAVARGTTSGDVYTISALALQINVGAPAFPVTVKTVDKPQTYIGDILTYTVVLNNIGADTVDATNVIFTDNLPPGLSFVSGSVTVDGVSQPAFDPIAGFSVGTISSGAIKTVRFRARVDSLPAAPAPAQFDNSAEWTYDYIPCAGSPTQQGQVVTDVATSVAPRLEPRKSVSPTGAVAAGTVLTYSITIPNTGEASTTGTTLQDAIPAGTVYVPNSTRLNGVSVADISGVMPYVTANMVNSPGEPAGQINMGESATITFQVTTSGIAATITNTASVDQDGPGPAAAQSAQAVNTALAAPGISKAFSPVSISEGSNSRLSVTLSNGNGVPLSAAAVTDTLPTGLTIANPANISTTCGGVASATPGGITLNLTGGTIPATSSCTLQADVTSQGAGTYTNTLPAGALSTSAGSNIILATADLTVTRVPLLSKSISPGTIVPNGVAEMTLSLTNPTSSAMTSATLTDALPSGMTVASPNGLANTCGGTATALSGSSSVTLSGGTIPALNSCTLTVNVTASAVGVYTNTIPAGGLSTSGGANTAPASATLTVPVPLISKSFSPNPVAINTNTTLTITLSNLTPTAITGASFTDAFPTSPGAMTYQSTTSNSCGGTLADSGGGGLASGDVGIRLTGGTIPASSTCSVVVVVRAAASGNYLNSIPSLSTTNGGTNSTGASANLSVAQPAVAKTFGTFTTPVTTIPTDISVPLTIQLTNPTAAVITAATFNDVFPTTPGAMTLANTTISNTCGGTVADSGGGTLNAGDVGIRLSGGSIPTGASGCLITVNVIASAPGIYTNTIPAGALSSSSGSNAAPASALITVLARPTIVKSFSPNPVGPSGISTLTLTLGNTNSFNLTGAAFTDTFPSGLTVASPLTTTNTCGGNLLDQAGGTLAAGDLGIQLSAGTIPGNSSCVIAVNVTGTVVGTYTNTIGVGGLTTSNGGSNTSAANADLVIQILPPTITKSFLPNPVPSISTNTVLTFTLTNPNIATSLTGVAFSDTLPTLPGPMVVAPAPLASTSGCGTPVFAPVANSGVISFSGGTIAPGGTCIVSVNVREPVPGTYDNTSSPVTSTNGGIGGTASASVTVLSPPAVAKAFSVNPVAVNTPTVLSLTVSNPNSTAPLTGVSVNDTYPAGLVNTATPMPAINCSAGSSGIFTGGAAGGNTIGMIGGTLLAGGSCTVQVNVSSAADGSYLNTTNPVTSNEATGGVAGAELLYVSAVPSLTKSFGVSSLDLGDTTTLTLEITNANTNLAYQDLAVTDNFPAGLEIAATPGLTNTCGGTLSPGGSAGHTSLVLSGGTLAAGASCQIQVNVTATAAGALTNTTNSVTSSSGGTGNSANASLNVVAPKIGIAKALHEIVHSTNATDNVYTLVYRLTVENFSSVTLNNLEINDDVATPVTGQFSGLSPTNFNTWVTTPANAVALTPAPTLNVNGSWNGTATSNVLLSGQSLNAGESKLVYLSFDVTVNPAVASPDNRLRDNSATVKSTTPSSLVISDTSTNGTDPDGADNDNNPDEDSTTPAAFVKLVKEVRNCGNSLSSCSGSYVTSEAGEPGDYLEYRITYYNISSQAISTLIVGDSLVSATPFQEDTYSLLSPSGIADFSVECPDTTVIDIDRSNVAIVTTPPSGAISAFDIDVMASSVCDLASVNPSEHGILLFKVRIP